jgi:hypothetical protein
MFFLQFYHLAMLKLLLYSHLFIIFPLAINLIDLINLALFQFIYLDISFY